MNSHLLNPNGIYYAYLRKSRKDIEAESYGNEETLARHRKMLIELADSLGITISKFYKEIVSGDTIQNRPEIQRLLLDISSGNCDGVLVVEVERLARGDTIDQGTVASYFKLSNTLIITPLKIYDPNDDFDEEYFEYGLFQSRREYKTINRRLQRGRLASAKVGKWVTSSAPYGYERIKIPNDKGYTLKIIPEQAEIVKFIFDLYSHGELQSDGSYERLGFYRICKKLDNMGIKPVNSVQWSPSTIKDMLKNPSYIGKITFGKEQDKVILENGQKKKVRVKNTDYNLYNGCHEAIISEEQYYLVQKLINSKPIYPVVSNKNLKNPLAGLVYCSQCGALLTRMANNAKTPYPALKCPTRSCSTVSSPLYLVEEKILEGIRNWFEGYKLTWSDEKVMSNQIAVKENILASCQIELNTLGNQKNKAYDFLEQGLYTTEVFSNRIAILDSKIQEISTEIQRLQAELELEKKKDFETNTFIPHVESLLDAYWIAEDAAVRNDILKDIIDHVEYTKTQPNKKFQRDNANFTLNIFPKLPKL